MTSKEELLEVLNRAFSKKYNSLAAYVLAANPYLRDDQQHILIMLEEIADQDQELCQQIAQVVETMDAVPRIIPYDHMVSDLNYLSLDFLLTVVISDLEKQIDQYEHDLEAIAGSPETTQILTTLRENSRNHLERLSEFV